MLKKWENLPDFMKKDEVYPYYLVLYNKRFSLLLKRLFDITLSAVLLVLFIPLFIIMAVLIKLDSKGKVFYKSTRVTQYGKKFKIFKFRTMVENADKIGSQVTVNKDNRITELGNKIRKYRIDEIPQLINIFLGDMSFVGTRPETDYYVANYTNEMYATLLLPAGVTSIASIEYKDEAELLNNAEDVDKVYIEKILPIKMQYNLNSIKNYSFLDDIKIMIKTVFAVLN
ncbi:MAG: sugar transferase [Peptoniphilus harei]|uniref:sugar transferase n=1 Tax=Peptoniphilus harei TaxID=54005 RepID=UPI00290051CE|nr:sugar transferase [Peptoniphilus harei]MDU3086944.1 sugar transferase [Peptoniphilus harei]